MATIISLVPVDLISVQMPKRAAYGSAFLYLMRAIWTPPGPDPQALIYWTYTSIDDTGAQSGRPVLELSQITFIKEVIQ